MIRFVIVTAVMLAATEEPAAAGKRFKVKVTREDSNFYKVDGTDYIVQTESCFVFGYGKSAILEWSSTGSYSNKLIFLDYEGKEDDSCRIKRLLVETEP